MSYLPTYFCVNPYNQPVKLLWNKAGEKPRYCLETQNDHVLYFHDKQMDVVDLVIFILLAELKVFK